LIDIENYFQFQVKGAIDDRWAARQRGSARRDASSQRLAAG
jgi:hypothetical protein